MSDVLGLNAWHKIPEKCFDGLNSLWEKTLDYFL
jgi:hypothetical protein